VQGIRAWGGDVLDDEGTPPPGGTTGEACAAPPPPAGRARVELVVVNLGRGRPRFERVLTPACAPRGSAQVSGRRPQAGPAVDRDGLAVAPCDAIDTGAACVAA
jgi:hypothetical protein